MQEGTTITQNERVLAALAHGSVLLGVLTDGLGGVFVALLVWLAQKEKSAYVADQALQALVYQIVTMVVAAVFWMAWLAMWMGMILLPVFANPSAYDSAPPAGLWVGLILMIVPIAVTKVLVLYGLWGALRCLGGHPFHYALIGRWVGSDGFS